MKCYKGVIFGGYFYTNNLYIIIEGDINNVRKSQQQAHQKT